MLGKILALLILSIGVDSIAPDQEPKYAVSTQSFHRDDVPLSYKYTAVHIYSTPRPKEQRPYLISNHQEAAKYHTIQYAPIEKNSLSDHRHKHVPEIHEQFVNSEESPKNHLEPREVENFDQSYRSFVPGHNVEVLPSRDLNSHNELYRDYHGILENQKVNLPKFVIQQNPQQYVQNIPEHLRTFEQKPLLEEHNMIYSNLPRHTGNTQHSYVFDTHNVPQALKAKIPRLHLNIARVYGLAHVPLQAPANKPGHRQIVNPPAYTQAIFHPLNAPQKTILYPVQDTRKNYPLHT